MAVIEIITFRTADNVAIDEVRRRDQCVQEDFAYQQNGLVRRTFARTDDRCLIVQTWRSAAHAAIALEREAESDAVARLHALAEAGTWERTSYSTTA